MSEFDITTLTEDDLDSATTSQLREWSDAINHYSRRTDIANFRLSPELIGQPGALTAVDKLLSFLKIAYLDREPVIEANYGNIEVKVWAEDTQLRDTLKYRRRVVIEEQEKKAISEEFGTYATA